MSTQLSRVFLGLAVLLVAWFVRDEAYIVLQERPLWPYEDEVGMPFVLSNALAAGVLLIGWWAVWRTLVHWTAARVGLTILAAASAVSAAWLVVLSNDALLGSNVHAVHPWDLGGLLAAGVWIGATAYLWRGGPTRHIAKLPCPRCGYDLRGLHEARCPECGTQYTLDGLLAAQAAVELRTHGDAERHVDED
jgi:hypothetical protein